MSLMAGSDLCRICLEKEATTPIFDNAQKPDSIYSKLSLCLGDPIQDTNGYPRHICKLCQITLNTVCNFIKKYKASCKTLEKGFLAVVKQEVIELSDSCNEDNDFGFENDYEDMKIKPKIEFNNAQDVFALLKPYKDISINKSHKAKKNQKVKKFKEKVNKKERKSKRVKPKKEYANVTNTIASSLLEGTFSWNGDEWYLGSVPVVKKEKDKVPAAPPVPKEKSVGPPPVRLCDLCGQVFNNMERLKAHKAKAHSDIQIKCPHCPRVCASEYALNRHIKRLHTERGRDFICSACGKAYAFKGELTHHYTVVHEKHKRKKKVYECKKCNKTYACAKSVLMHDRSVHTGERPDVCETCGATFSHADYLKEHMRLHTGETPFKCPVCNRGYAQRCNMKSHIRHNHKISDLDSISISTIKQCYLRLMKP